VGLWCETGSYEFSVANVYRQKGHQYYRRWVPIALPDEPDMDQVALHTCMV
jgi:hypothetical protein